MRHGLRATAVIFVLCLTGCVAHPVGPARTYAKYEGKAVTTAKSALGAVQTARLAAEAASRHHLPGAYVGLTLGEAEDGVAGVSGTFASIQPPGAAADRLAAELTGVLRVAEDHLRSLRVAARRGAMFDLARMAAPLAGDADQLEAFVKAHQ